MMMAETSLAQATRDAQWSTTVQTGLADTFQLTLGGQFGGGPAWQNKVTTGIRNAFRSGDSFSIYGWNTLDAGTHATDWQAGFGYQTTVIKRRGHLLSLGSGLQHWRFPSVKTGTNDWLLPGNLVYQAPLPKHCSFIATVDTWTLLDSPLPLGSLLHTQTWLQRSVINRERLQIGFKTGPAHTFSWNFYGTHGNRVLRYQSMLTLTYGATVLEGGYRKQWGFQHGIPDNAYWQFSLSHTLTRPFVAR
jgi:hypothetical protein